MGKQDRFTDEFKQTVSKTLDSFGAFRKEAQEKYDHAIAALTKLQIAKSVLAASEAAKFASQMGNGE